MQGNGEEEKEGREEEEEDEDEENEEVWEVGRTAGGTKGRTAICPLCGHIRSEWHATLPLSQDGALKDRISPHAHR